MDGRTDNEEFVKINFKAFRNDDPEDKGKFDYVNLLNLESESLFVIHVPKA